MHLIKWLTVGEDLSFETYFFIWDFRWSPVAEEIYKLAGSTVFIAFRQRAIDRLFFVLVRQLSDQIPAIFQERNARISL